MIKATDFSSLKDNVSNNQAGSMTGVISFLWLSFAWNPLYLTSYNSALG